MPVKGEDRHGENPGEAWGREEGSRPGEVAGLRERLPLFLFLPEKGG